MILALLAMFGLIALAFVVVAGHAQRSAQSIERIDLAYDPPDKLLFQAAMQLFRGSNSQASVIGAHSLLETMYGNDAAAGKITVVNNKVCGGQLIEFTFDPVPANPYARIGCIITMLDGPAKGVSSRIVGFNPKNLNPQMLAFDGGGQPISGNRAIINGVPFSGRGLLKPEPNPIFVPEARDPSGGANCDYTAVDFQHMLLAMQTPDKNGGVTTALPSLHRPDLVRYQKGKGVAMHNYVLRPLTAEHPDFTGSNPKFKADWDGASTDGQWDVDNDGDGVPDSVWVDLGMPARATADGRLYKPLFAILCVDLDGRLNVNAHGCWAQVDHTMTTKLDSLPLAGGPVSALPRGMGYGPAEISLLPILNNDPALYVQLLKCRYPAAGLGSDVAAHRLHLNKWFLYGYGNYWDFTAANNAGVFGSPPDLLGTATIGLDWTGRPLYVDMGQNINSVQCAYEYDLSAKRARGGMDGAEGFFPFSVAELERLLRPYDRDAASLPNRLARATAPGPNHWPQNSVLLSRRCAVTTESWDVPVPPVAGVPNGGSSPKHVTDLLKVLLIKKSNALYSTNPMTDAEATAVLPELFAPELLMGRKVDLNRAFGNGLDDGNGVVDGPWNDSEEVSLYNSATGSGKASSFKMNYDSTGTVVDSLAARQLYARYLFVLADLLTDRDTLKSLLSFSNPDDVPRFLAQWAVNVVDFCDRDSIMTPFDFDSDYASKNPVRHPQGAGWHTPSDASHRVWGCERPELLITETLAFHDRRTEDLATEIPDDKEPGNEGRTGPGKTDNPDDTPFVKTKDVSFDQRYKPEGSLFVELYNPWTGNREPAPVELYDHGSVHLAKTVPGNLPSPVWRLVIMDKDSEADPTSPAKINLAVYFVNSTMVKPELLPVDPPSRGQPTDARIKYQPTSPVPSLAPGCYMVIGPDRTTCLGFRIGENPGSFSKSATRRIELNPPTTVLVYNNGRTPDPVGIVPPIAVAIDRPQRLSVSEPEGGYNKPGYDPVAGYNPPYDIPFDAEDSSPMKTYIQKNQQSYSVKLIRLQRLANPLIAYHPIANPYRTVDTMPIDLTAFNGITEAEDPQVGAGVPNLFAHQRGQTNGSTPTNYILWRQEGVESIPAANVKAPIPQNAGPEFNFHNALHHSLGYLNNPFNPPDADGNVQSPFPWLTWNNRPFVSHLELLLVPWTKSGDLCGVFPNDRVGSGNPYNEWGKPFSHMLSFLQSYTLKPARLYRILDFVSVPSQFVGAEIQANPTVTNSGDHIFHPPFNRISTYREPGKINLNTIFSEEVYNGLMSGLNTSPPIPSWSDFDASRHGDGPNMFACPFRSFVGADLSPPGASGALDGREVNATVLRRHLAQQQPLFSFSSTFQCNDTTRNPFFYYQGLERLGNLVTTRSNVYAIWITAGYFGVEPGGVDSAHPDGYRLGHELGMDTGEIERHRAFYIFDRSLPVGFQRGQDLNVEKAILAKRYIE